MKNFLKIIIWAILILLTNLIRPVYAGQLVITIPFFIWEAVITIDVAMAIIFIAAVTYSIVQANNLKNKLKNAQSKYAANEIINTVSNEEIVPLIYGGPLVVGGNIIWQSDPGTTVQRFLGLCVGEISSITEVKLDNIDINTLSGCSYTAYYGTATQTVDSRGSGTVKGLRHVAYIAATITAGDKVSGNPTLSTVITGRKIQTWNGTNWTTNSPSSSRNPAAITRDYLLLSPVLGGCGIPSDFIDEASFGEASEICDELVDNGAGGTERRYELSIVIDQKDAALDNLMKFFVTCNMALVKSGNVYKIAIEKSSETAVQAFTEDVINKGTFVYGYGQPDTMPNRVEVKWIEPLEPKNPKRIAIAEDELDQEIRGKQVLSIETYGIDRQSQASRLAKKILYERKINDIWCEFEADMVAMHCEPFDVVSVTHSRPNWTAALFRTVEIEEVSFGKAKYKLQAYNGSVVDDRFGSTFDDWDYGSPPNPYEPVPDVSDLIISEVGWINADGTYVIHIDVSWTAPSSKREFLDIYIIELKKGSDDYIVVGHAPASAIEYRINSNLEAGISYIVRVKTKSKEGIISNGTVSSGITIVGKASAPNNVSGFIYAWSKELEIMWNLVVGADIAGYEVRDENANFGTDNSRLIYRGQANRKVLVPSSRAPGTYYVKAFNFSGKYSNTAVSITPINNAPSQPVVTLSNWFGFAILSWTDDDTEKDIVYYEVYKSDTNLWTGEETLYSRTSGKSAQVQGKAPVDAAADSANATSITDADLIGKGVDYFVGDIIKQTSGTYINQETVITAFNNATGQVSVTSWPYGTPSTNDKFALKDRAHFKVRGVDRYGQGLFSSSMPVDFVQLAESEIGDNIITARKITTGELITLSAQIRDAVITSAKIFDLDASKIVANTITADKYNQLRNTYVYDSEDSLDATYSFEIPFKIVSEMISIQSVELSFKIKNFRAYSTGVPSGGGSTTPSGGGSTTLSGGGSTSGNGVGGHYHTISYSAGAGNAVYVNAGNVWCSGGGTVNTDTVESHLHTFTLANGSSGTQMSTAGGTGAAVNSSATGTGATWRSDVVNGHFHTIIINAAAGGALHFNYSGGGLYLDAAGSGSIYTESAASTHSHTTPAHTHDTPAHTHDTPAHTHSLTFGIYEEANSPTIHYHIDNGAGYGAASANYTTDQIDLNITSSISGTGWKRIKFDTTARCIIAAVIECKLDILA